MKEQKKHTKIMLAWTLAWVVSLAFLSYGANFLEYPHCNTCWDGGEGV